MARLLIGTSAGLFELEGAQVRQDAGFGERDATAVIVDDAEVWAIADRRSLVWRDPAGTWTEVAATDELEITCLLPTAHGFFVGTEEARLFRLQHQTLAPVESFDRVEGRQKWYTPWGGPPAVRSMAVDLAGRIHVNVHVGGIPRSTDGARTWEPTIDIDADVHQVIAHPTQPDLALAAGAVGLAHSEDGGTSWSIDTDGLRATYARAVAVAGDAVMLSASDGPGGGHAAVYRTPLGPSIHLQRCTEGLPEWFEGNIDTGSLAASDSTVAFASNDGRAFISVDTGERWRQLADGLPTVRSLCFA
jgi:hypothetical protein